MPRYSDDSREKVRDAVDMVDLVQTRTELRRSGAGSYMGRCPFHDERTASFSVDAGKKMYHCFGCGVGGDAFRFVQETEGLDFVGALESLAQRYGVELEVEDEDPRAAEERRRRERLLELLERAAVFYVRWLWDSAEAAPARAYLAERGLEEATLREFRVGYAPSAWDKLLMAGRQQGYRNRELFDAGLAVRAKGEGRIYDRFRRRIMFPLCDPRGRVLGFGARALGRDQQPKYLNSADGEIFHKGDHVFAAHLARQAAARADRVIACEGYTDVLAFHQAGIKNTVGIMGTALTERQIGELAKLSRKIVLALDADSAGQDAMLRAARVAQKQGLELRVVTLPDNLDPADLVQQRGAEAARETVDGSIPFVRFRVFRALDGVSSPEPEEKERLIAELAPTFGLLSPGLVRDELLAFAAGRLHVNEGRLAEWLARALIQNSSTERGTSGPTAPRGAGSSGGNASRSAASPSRAGLISPVAKAERAFLAQCIAAPGAAEEVLAGLPTATFSSDAIRRVAEHVKGHLHAPETELPPDDPTLERAVAALVADAARLTDSPDALRLQFATLQLLRLNQQIDHARRAGVGGVTELVRQRDTLTQRRDSLLQRVMEASAPGD